MTTLNSPERPATMTSAQVLRAAAAKLRGAVEDIDSDTPWWDTEGLRDDFDTAAVADLEWIALMDPAVAEPLAELLLLAIQPRTGRNRHRGRVPVSAAVAVARVILGEA